MARKILLADDSVTAQNMGRKILTDAGYEVVTVNNGSAALKKIFDAKPDLIVLDVYMPGYSGLEVCQRIKENKDCSRIPILLTVGKLEPFKPEEARRVRADAFVVKPFEASELLAALARLEDKIVPQPEPYKPGRFAKAVAAVDEMVGVDKDESWKARLRIPTHGPEDEAARPDARPVVPEKGSRDLSAADSAKKPPFPHREGVFEPPLPSGLPSDITPEEIAAITAAAAQLRGNALHPPLPDLPAPPPPSIVAEVATPGSEHESTSPVTFASAPEAPSPSDGISLAQAGGSAPSETADVSAASATEVSTVADVATSSTPEAQSADVRSETETSPVTSTIPAEDVAAIEAPVNSLPAPELVEPEPAVAEMNALETPAPVVSSPAPVPAEPPVPVADDEVMAALQSLMPVDTAQQPTNLASAVPDAKPPIGIAAIVANVDSTTLKAHVAGPHWIAEEVALSQAEAGLSLEREMEQAYATAAIGDALATSAVATINEPSQASTETSTADSVSIAAAQEPPAESSAAYAMAASASDAGAIHAIPPVTMPQPEAQRTQENEIPAAGSSASVAHLLQPVVEEPGFTPSVESQSSPDIEISGGVEDMAASWKNIRDSIASGGAAKAAVAKEKEEVIDAGIEVHESAAPVPAPAASTSASDPKAIASIVDSVLAELRPKIVEEIAKKLADSKKE